MDVDVFGDEKVEHGEHKGAYDDDNHCDASGEA